MKKVKLILLMGIFAFAFSPQMFAQSQGQAPKSTKDIEVKTNTLNSKVPQTKQAFMEEMKIFPQATQKTISDSWDSFSPQQKTRLLQMAEMQRKNQANPASPAITTAAQKQAYLEQLKNQQK